jgi:isoamylase
MLPDGTEMSEEEWKQESARCLGLFLAGDGLDEVDEHNEPISDDSFLVLMNASHESVSFRLPALQQEGTWISVLDTSNPRGNGGGERKPNGFGYPLEARSMVVLVASGARQMQMLEHRR